MGRHETDKLEKVKGVKKQWLSRRSEEKVCSEDGMKLGYQDAGSWTLMQSTPEDRAKASWLYTQFTVAQTVSLKKSHVGLHG